MTTKHYFFKSVTDTGVFFKFADNINTNIKKN